MMCSDSTDYKPLNFDLGIDRVKEHIAQTRQYTIGDLLQKNVRVHGDSTAILGENGERLTYDELGDRVHRLANVLIERGVDHGSTIAVIMENRPELIETLFAGAKIGAIVPTQNWRLGQSELLHCLEITDPDVVIVSGKHVEKSQWIKKSQEISPELIGLADADVGLDYESLIKSASPSKPVATSAPSSEDGAVVLYTSGTTGLPKGAVISHRSLINRGMLWTRMADMKRNPDFVGWNPLFHMGGVEPLMAVMINGGTFYTIDGFQLNLILDRQQQANANYLIVFPSVIESIIEYAETHDWRQDDYGIDIIGVMPDLYPKEKIKQITNLFDADFLNSFGTTETGLPPCSDNVIPAGSEPRRETLSKIESPFCDVRLVDENWDEVPHGEVGEIAVRGPTLFSGYINNRKANLEDFDDGWFRTGDMFSRTEKGKLTYIDRRKYLIKSGGENIYPAEIERFLVDHPDILNAGVVRVSDDKWGEVPVAYISTIEGSDLTADSVVEFLSDRIARYKLPHYVEFVNESVFERSTTGKIQRQKLEDREIPSKRVRDP